MEPQVADNPRVRALARRLGLALLLGPTITCVDGGLGAPFPSPSGPFGSRLFAITCGPDDFVLAMGTDDPAPLSLPNCEGEAEYHVAYFAESLEALGLSPGPVVFGPCPGESGIGCVEDQLPTPKAGRLFVAHRPASGPLSAWTERNGGWPTHLGTRILPRKTRCRPVAIETIRGNGYKRISGAFIGANRLLLMGDPWIEPFDTENVIHFFDVSIDELRRSGLPPVPTSTLAGYVGADIESNPATGEVAVGLAGDPFILRGRFQDGLRIVPHVDPSRLSARIALSLRDRGEGHLAVRDGDHPEEVFLLRDGEWSRFDGSRDLVSRCAPERVNGQRGSMLWIDNRELIVMPSAAEWTDVRVRTATNSPDGYWHFIDGSATWHKVDARAPDDCVGHLALLGPLGLVAMTRDPQFFRLGDEGWEPLRVFGLPQQPFDDTIRHSVPIEHGFAYTRQGRRFGYVVDGIACQEFALDNTELEEIETNGEWLVVFGDAPRSNEAPHRLTGPSSIHLIRFEAPRP